MKKHLLNVENNNLNYNFEKFLKRILKRILNLKEEEYMSNLEYLKKLDAETVKEELICFLLKEGLEDFTEEFTNFICEDLSRGDIG